MYATLLQFVIAPGDPVAAARMEIRLESLGWSDRAALPLLVDRWPQSRGCHRQFRAAATVIRATGKARSTAWALQTRSTVQHALQHTVQHRLRDPIGPPDGNRGIANQCLSGKRAGDSEHRLDPAP